MIDTCSWIHSIVLIVTVDALAVQTVSLALDRIQGSS